MRRNLQVIGKPLTYATRRLMPGDPFSASERDARLLIRMKRACEVRDAVKLPAPPAELLAKFDHDSDGRPGGSKKQPNDLTALRKQYFETLGKRPFNGWDAETLAKKIAEA